MPFDCHSGALASIFLSILEKLSIETNFYAKEINRNVIVKFKKKCFKPQLYRNYSLKWRWTDRISPYFLEYVTQDHSWQRIHWSLIHQDKIIQAFALGGFGIRINVHLH